MPTLADYQGLAPFSLDELVQATNGVLRRHPRLEVTRRTLRYYIAEGALPPPSGPPKFARYDMEHLLRAVGLRTLSAQGLRLDEARRELDEILSRPRELATLDLQNRVEELEGSIAAAFIAEASPPAPSPHLEAPAWKATKAAPRARSAPAPLQGRFEPVLRIPLSPGVTLEVAGTELERDRLWLAAEEFRRLLDSL